MKQLFPGNELYARRKELGMSVYEAFRHTRVPAEYIEALERADLSSLPDECYTAGFLRTYCEYLGLNGERFVDTYRACMRPVAATRFLRRQHKAAKAPPWLNEAMTWAVISAILILGWVSYAVVFRPQSDPADHQVKAGTIEMVVPPTPAGDKE